MWQDTNHRLDHWRCLCIIQTLSIFNLSCSQTRKSTCFHKFILILQDSPKSTSPKLLNQTIHIYRRPINIELDWKISAYRWNLMAKLWLDDAWGHAIFGFIWFDMSSFLLISQRNDTFLFIYIVNIFVIVYRWNQTSSMRLNKAYEWNTKYDHSNLTKYDEILVHPDSMMKSPGRSQLLSSS